MSSLIGNNESQKFSMSDTHFQGCGSPVPWEDRLHLIQSSSCSV